MTLELQVLNRIEQLFKQFVTRTLQSSFYINRSGTTSVTANEFTQLTSTNSKRLKLFVQNPSSATATVLIRLLDKNSEHIVFELTPGREFEVKLEDTYIYTGPVFVAASVPSVAYYSYEVERL